MPKPGIPITAKPSEPATTDPDTRTPSLVSDLSLQENELWRRGRGTLYWRSCAPDKNVQVLFYGTMIIYQHDQLSGVSSSRKYALRWNKGNSNIIRLDSLTDLMKVGEELFDSFPTVWNHISKEDVRELFPDWVRPWLEACAEDNCYYDPASLKE